MAGQKHRTQILLEPEQHQALVAIARQEDRSVSDVVREIVDRSLAQRAEGARRERALRALDRLAAMRGEIERRSGVYRGDLVAEARAERAGQAEHVWGGE